MTKMQIKSKFKEMFSSSNLMAFFVVNNLIGFNVLMRGKKEEEEGKESIYQIINRM